MDYATTHHIGQHFAAHSSKAKAAAPQPRGVRKLDATHQRCRRNPKGQAAARSDSDAANALLRVSFLPKLAGAKTLQGPSETVKTERDFYQSLSRLAGHYGIEPMQSRQYGFPYNIALALDDVMQRLKKSVRNWDDIKLLHHSNKTFLATEERYNTGHTLYYIPVMPLYKLLRNPKRKAAAQLLLSVFAYLYHVADVPYYRQEDSFLYWQYEMLLEWLLSDDTDAVELYQRELTEAEYIGECMEKKMFNPKNLNVFGQRLNRFKSRDAFDADCLKLAQEAFDLYEKYPYETVFRNGKPNAAVDEDDGYDSDYMTTMEKYISFCADAKGWLSDSLIDCVNSYLKENSVTEEPVLTKRFDGSDLSGCNLDFENRLFDLMDELIFLLS